MKLKCLLVKLPDGRKFFTTKNNHEELLEFAAVFQARLEVVEAQDPEVLSLSELASAVCDQNAIPKNTVYETKNGPKPHAVVNRYTSMGDLSSRQQLRKKVSTIRDFIQSQFQAGKNVKIKNIAKKFSRHGMSVSTVYRHVAHVKDLLEADQKVVVKVSPGVYKLEKAG